MRGEDSQAARAAKMALSESPQALAILTRIASAPPGGRRKLDNIALSVYLAARYRGGSPRRGAPPEPRTLPTGTSEIESHVLILRSSWPLRSPPSGSGSAILLSPSMFPVYDNPSRRWSFRGSHFGLPGRKSPCFVAAFYLLEGQPPRRRDHVPTEYKCLKCWNTVGMPRRCCGVPMTRVSLDERIVWPLMWLPPQVERT